VDPLLPDSSHLSRRSWVVVGVVAGLGRFPVKSTAGESLSLAPVTDRGLQHDREWAAYTADGGIASGKTTRRFRKVDGLMRWQSQVPAGGDVPTLLSPDGEPYQVDDPAASAVLTRAFEQPLVLRPETSTKHHDECGVHLVTTSSVRRTEELVGGNVDTRRLRANIVLDTDGSGFLEDDWLGGVLALGPYVVLRLGRGMPRCVMVDQPQAGLPAGPPVLRTLGRIHETVLGAQASVTRTGVIALGDTARLLPR